MATNNHTKGNEPVTSEQDEKKQPLVELSNTFPGMEIDLTKFFGLIRKLSQHGWSQTEMGAMIEDGFCYDQVENDLSRVIRIWFEMRVKRIIELNPHLGSQNELMKTKDIDTCYLEDLKCELCGEPLKLLNYDRFSERKGQHFIVARMWCDDHKNIWVRPNKNERIYLDGPDAPTIKSLENVLMTISSFASSMEEKEVPPDWEISIGIEGSIDYFIEAIQSKLQILDDFEGVMERG